MVAPPSKNVWLVQLRLLELGNFIFRVFQLGEGRYCFRLAEVICVEQGNSELQRLLLSHQLSSNELPKSLWIEQLRQSISPVSLTAAEQYWQEQVEYGNYEAKNIVRDLTRQSLLERIEVAFSQA